MAYVSVAMEVDPSAITQEKVDSLQAKLPGLVIREGHILFFLLEATSDRDAQNAQLLTDVTDLVWDTFGDKILRLPRLLATQATGISTWTRVDTPDFPLASPLTIPAGTGVTVTGLDGDRVAFTTVADVTFSAAAASTAAGEVALVATLAGTAGTGLSGNPQADDAFTWLNTITIIGLTSGGDDEETVDEFRDRLADEAALMARTLILPADFAARARNITGVDVALAIDNYNPPTAGVAGHITVTVRDPSGADPGSGVRAAVLADLQANALTNLAIHVIAPTYTTITVVFSAKAYPGFDPADVQARAIAAVLDFLSPARWGLPPFGDQRIWLDKPIVRRRDVVAVIENVEGLDYTLAPAGTATTVSGNANLTVVTPTTAGWVNGMIVTGAGIPANTRILSGAGTATMVMSANATANASGVAITGDAVTVNNGTADVTLTGPAALPGPSSTATGLVT